MGSHQRHNFSRFNRGRFAVGRNWRRCVVRDYRSLRYDAASVLVRRPQRAGSFSRCLHDDCAGNLRRGGFAGRFTRNAPMVGTADTSRGAAKRCIRHDSCRFVFSFRGNARRKTRDAEIQRDAAATL